MADAAPPVDDIHARERHAASRNHRLAKRRKIAVACDECRNRKVRCDGVQPVCGACARRSDHGIHCIYTVEPEKKRAIRNYVTTLEKRIKVLEQTHGYPVSAPQSNGDTTPHSQPPLPPPPPPTSVPRPHAPRSNEGDGYDGFTSALGAVADDPSRMSQGFFGSSSATSFMRSIKNAVDNKPDSPDLPDSALAGSDRRPTLTPLRRRSKQSNITNFVLPPRKMADDLMEVYWELVYPLFPFLDSERLRIEYAKIWSGETFAYDENMLMCIINGIFALSVQLSDFVRPEEREATAELFYTRAKDLLHLVWWHSGSIELIQGLLLMGQYLQSTDSAHQCWIVVGLAIRNAQSLGIHLPQTISRMPTYQEQEVFRRIWHGCVLMDRVLQMTFGRPGMISRASADAVPLPANIDDEFLFSTHGPVVHQPPGQPSVMEFYTRSLGLYRILHEILLSLYMPLSDEPPEDIVDYYYGKEKEGDLNIFELNRALTKWFEELPPHLKDIAYDPNRHPKFRRQAIVLRARFLHIRMLLFRPMLTRYCTAGETQTDQLLNSANDGFPQRVALQCSIMCVKVSQELIDLLFDNLPPDDSVGNLAGWWFNVLYVYQCATVFIAGRMRASILADVTEASLARSWHLSLEILRKYQDYKPSVRRSLTALQNLYEKVVAEGPIVRHDALSQAHTGHPSVMMPNTFGVNPLGEGLNVSIFDSYNFPDLQDMSWVNSVPGNLY